MQNLWSQRKSGGRVWRHIGALISCLGLFLSALAGSLSAASFTAVLDRDMVSMGESAMLTLKFEGGQPKGLPGLPAIPNLQTADRGTSQSISLVNGAMSTSISQTIELIPLQPGEYIIPALRANVAGQSLSSRPLRLKVVKDAAAAGGEAPLAFLKLVLPKKEFFLGEVVEVQSQLHVRDGVANADNVFRWFENLGSSVLKAEGFSVLKTAQSQQLQRVQVGNAIYVFATLTTSLTPVKTGALTLGSSSAILPLQIAGPNRRREGIDPFGMFQQYEERRVTVVAENISVKAMPLPREAAPADFSGAVGNYSLAVTAGPTNVAVGDPITLKIQISGRGALEALALPVQGAWPKFKAYPPTAKVETTDPLGIEGSKTFEQVVTAETADIKELPALNFSFFDPDKKVYRTLTQPPFGLVVRPSSPVALPSAALAARTSQSEPAQSQDIIHIKQNPGRVRRSLEPWLSRPFFWGVQSAPVLALMVSVVCRRKRESLANNPRLRRQRQVARLVIEGVGDLRRFASENNSELFFSTLVRLLQEQLGERLDLPASAITEAVVAEQMQPRGLPAVTVGALHDLFQTCNLARYAPIKSSQELAAFIPKIESTLRQLQEFKA